MLKYKMALITGMAAILLIFSLGLGQAATSTSVSGPVPQAESQVRIFKVANFIDKIKNNTLYLENKQRYSLRNVKVTKLSGSGNRISAKKRTAEMLFINGVLK